MHSTSTSKTKKVFFIFLSFLLLIIAAWVWYYGPNYFLPLPEKPIIKKNAIQMPIGKFILVRKDGRYAAIRILRATWNKGASYECYYQGDSTADFNSKSAIYKRGIVYERYDKMPMSHSEDMLKDNGSQLNIKCGEFNIEWSNQNWIYFKGYGEDQPSFDLAPTVISDVSQLDTKNKALQWISKTQP